MFLFQFIFSSQHFSPFINSTITFEWDQLVYYWMCKLLLSNLHIQNTNSAMWSKRFASARPSGHWPRGVSVDNTNTASAALKPSFSLFQFLREFFLPALPEVSYQILHSSPSLLQTKLGFIDLVWSKRSTKFSIEKMIWKQRSIAIQMWWLICQCSTVE